jgi:hypothetical protein
MVHVVVGALASALVLALFVVNMTADEILDGIRTVATEQAACRGGGPVSSIAPSELHTKKNPTQETGPHPWRHTDPLPARLRLGLELIEFLHRGRS